MNPNDLKKNLKRTYTWNCSGQHSRKYWIGKCQAMMSYMDSGFKNSYLTMTDWLFSWVDATKKQVYKNEWRRRKLPRSSKTSNKGSISNNYRPITWNIITVQIREIYDSLVCRRLFPKEQKRCHRETKEKSDLLYTYQHILMKTKARRKNVAMAWIDHKRPMI